MISTESLEESNTAPQRNNDDGSNHVPKTNVPFPSSLKTNAAESLASNAGRFTNSLRHQIRGRQRSVPNLDRSRLLVPMSSQNYDAERSTRHIRFFSASDSLPNESFPIALTLGNSNNVPIGVVSSPNATASDKKGGSIGSILLRRRRHSASASSSSMKLKIRSIIAQGSKSSLLNRRSKKKKIESSLLVAVSPVLASTGSKAESPSINRSASTRMNMLSTSAFTRIKMSSTSAITKEKIKNARKFNDGMVYLDGPQIYTCSHCRTHLTSHDDIISKSFHGRQGRAYLLDQCVNVTSGPAEYRMLITGPHSVTDIFCKRCKNKIGWSYVKAYKESQKYKEGKFIIEKINLFLEEQSHYDNDIEPPAGERFDKWKRRSMSWGNSSDRRNRCRYDDNIHESSCNNTSSVFKGEKDGRAGSLSSVRNILPRSGSSNDDNNTIYEYHPQQPSNSTGTIYVNHSLPPTLLSVSHGQQHEAIF